MPSFFHNGETIEYDIRLSKRAKRLSFVVHWNGLAELVVPANRVSERAIKRFVTNHVSWVAHNTSKMRANKNKTPLQHRGVSTAAVKERTEALVFRLIERFSAENPFKVSRVQVRPYRSRWGSCTQEGKISFHYKLSLLPELLAEYVVIHELCHTIHLNHSKDFWGLVEQCCSEYKDRRRTLLQYLI